MAVIGGLLVLLALVLSVCSLVGAIAPKVFSRFSKDGKGFSRLFLFFGFNIAAMVAMGIGGAMLPSVPADTTKTAAAASDPAQTASPPGNDATDDDSEPVAEEETATPAKENRAEFDFDFSTLRSRINADLKSMESPYRISANIRPSGDENSVNLMATASFSDNLSLLVAVTPDTKNVNGITVLYAPSPNRAENLRNATTAAILLAAADGDDGNKVVGSKILDMFTGAITEFADNGSSGSAKRKFIFNNIEYGILVAEGMPIMMFASPINKN